MIKVRSLDCRAPSGARHSLNIAWWLPSIIGSGVSAVGSLVNGIVSRKNTQETNAQNLQIARETNQMQLDAMRENNAWSENMAWDMFNAENAYNDPSAQKERLLSAGFNPASAMGSGAIAQSSASGSAPSAAGSVPNFIAPTMQTPPTVIGSAIDSIGKLSQAYATFKQGQKTDRETDWIDKDFEAKIKNVLSEADSNIMLANHQKLMNVLDSYFMPAKLKREIKKLDQEILTLAADENYKDALAKVQEAEERIKKIMGDRENEATPIILDNLKRTGKVLESQEVANKASAEASRGSAAQSYSAAELNKQLVNESLSREDLNKQQHQFIQETWAWSKSILESQSQSAIYNLIENKETILWRIEQAKKLPGLTQRSIDMLDQQIEQLKKANNWYNVSKAVEVLQGICGAYADYTGGMENVTGAVKNLVPFYIAR